MTARLTRWTPLFPLLILPLLIAFVPRVAMAGSVTVNITDIRVHDWPGPPGYAGQYRAMISIGGLQTLTSWRWSDHEGLETPIVLDTSAWSHTVEWNPQNGEIPIEVMILEGDGFGLTDQLDLNSIDGELNVDFAYTPTQTFEEISFSGDGDMEHMPFYGGGYRASITLEISVGDDVYNATLPPSCRPYDAAEDRDEDGYNDGWETDGWDADCDGTPEVDFPAYGADPDHKDVFIELDWVVGSEPTRFVIDRFKQIFADAPVDNPDGTTGIRVWVDTGGLVDPETLVGPVGDNLGGGTPIGIQVIEDFEAVEVLAQTHLDPAHAGMFRYAISAPMGFEGDDPIVDGCENGIDDDSDGLEDYADPDCRPDEGGTASYTTGIMFVRLPRCPGNYCEAGAAVLAHELGHTMGLRHGGDERNNCKPNYVSLMNYAYAYGIPMEDGTFRYDFSPALIDGDSVKAPLPFLDETALDETAVLDDSVAYPAYNIVFSDAVGNLVQSPANAPIDWNGDGYATHPATPADIDNLRDTNGDSYCGESKREHWGHDDWNGETGVQLRFETMGTYSGLDRDREDRTVSEMPLHRVMDLHEAINTTDLRLEVHPMTATVVAGEKQEYSVIVVNKGPNPAYGGRLQVDVADPDLSITTADKSCAIVEGGLECDLGALMNGDQRSMTFEAPVPASAMHGSLLLASFVVDHTAGPDAEAANNVAAFATPIVVEYDLGVAVIAANPITLAVGNSAYLDFTSTVALGGTSGTADLSLRFDTEGNSQAIQVQGSGEQILLDAAVGESRKLRRRVRVTCRSTGTFLVNLESEVSLASEASGHAWPARDSARTEVRCDSSGGSRDLSLPRR